MWFKLAGATFSNNLGTMDSISKSYMMDYSGLTGLSASPGSVSYATDSTPDATITFTVKSGYVFKSGATVTASGGATGTYTASADIAAGSTFTLALTGITGKVTFSGAAELVSGGSTGSGSEGDDSSPPSDSTTGTTYDVLLPMTITQGAYIKASLGITEMSAYNVAKAPVTPGMSITISARVGTAAAICWVDDTGKRTLLTMGNNNDGVNVNITETVPNGISYIECSYVNSSAFSLTSQGNFVTVSTPTPVSTTTGKYIDSTGLEAELSAMSYDKFTVSAGQYYYISNRNGTSSAAVSWVNSDGSKTVALVGNTNAGVNVNMVVMVPTDVSSMLVSYANTQTHIVTLVKEA